jgi:hypothetical protein
MKRNLISNHLKEESTHLKEMALICRKEDGFGIVIEIYSEDHGILGDKNQPTHAHIKTTDNQYLGKFAITKEPPRSFEYIFDCDKSNIIPSSYKKIIVDWSSKKNKNNIKNWTALKFGWEILHP